jgi:hypothetical protein
MVMTLQFSFSLHKRWVLFVLLLFSFWDVEISKLPQEPAQTTLRPSISVSLYARFHVAALIFSTPATWRYADSCACGCGAA